MRNQGAMKMTLVLFLLISTMAGCGPSEADKKLAQAELQRTMDASNARLQRQLLDKKIDYVRVKFGPVDAREFELCNTVPPKNKKHQDECAALLKKVDAASKAEPVW